VLSSASNPLNVEGVELSTDPDFSGPVNEAQEKIAADCRKRSTSPNRNRNGTQRQSTEAQVGVPWTSRLGTSTFHSNVNAHSFVHLELRNPILENPSCEEVPVIASEFSVQNAQCPSRSNVSWKLFKKMHEERDHESID
jgi:hypothetical protein